MTINNEFINYYFKVEFGGPQLISGLPLPNPDNGPYRFIRCTFHPYLENELETNYKDSTFDDCDK